MCRNATRYRKKWSNPKMSILISQALHTRIHEAKCSAEATGECAKSTTSVRAAYCMWLKITHPRYYSFDHRYSCANSNDFNCGQCEENINHELRSPCGEAQTPIPRRILANMVRESSRQWHHLRDHLRGVARSLRSWIKNSIIILIQEWRLRATPATSALFPRLYTRSGLIWLNAKWSKTLVTVKTILTPSVDECWCAIVGAVWGCGALPPNCWCRV